MLSPYILAIFGQNIQARLFECSARTFCPFLLEMYRLGCLSAQPLHFADFWLKCTGWGVSMLSPYILAIFLAKMYWPGCLARTFCPLLVKMYSPVCLNAQPVHFAHLWLKCTGWAV